MKVKNLQARVIGIGDVTILPDQEKEIPKKYEKNPALADYEALGFISITRDPAPKPAEKTEKPEKKAEPAVKRDQHADAKTRKSQLLKEVNDNVSEERLAAIAKELGINMATVKSQAGLLKKVKTELSK